MRGLIPNDGKCPKKRRHCVLAVRGKNGTRENRFEIVIKARTVALQKRAKIFNPVAALRRCHSAAFSIFSIADFMRWRRRLGTCKPRSRQMATSPASIAS